MSRGAARRIPRVCGRTIDTIRPVRSTKGPPTMLRCFGRRTVRSGLPYSFGRQYSTLQASGWADHLGISVRSGRSAVGQERRLRYCREYPCDSLTLIPSTRCASLINLLKDTEMALFRLPSFKSKDDKIEVFYTNGVLAVQAEKYDLANTNFRKAAEGGHVSAFYNLALLNGAGYISPYDLDLAIDYFYKAANAEHPTATENRWLLEAADRGGFGTQNPQSSQPKPHFRMA